MAWALQFDGVNDYVTTASGGGSSTALMPTQEYSIEFKIKRLSETDGYIFVNSYSGVVFSVLIRSLVGSLTFNGSMHSSVEIPYDGESHTVKAIYSGASSSVTIFLDDMINPAQVLTGKDVTFGVHNGGTGSLHRLMLGRYQHTNGKFLHADIEYLNAKDLAGSTEFNLSASASDHSNTGLQPVLVDTIGGNNATGVGFATDGSAWFDLGGGTTFKPIWAFQANKLIGGM